MSSQPCPKVGIPTVSFSAGAPWTEGYWRGSHLNNFQHESVRAPPRATRRWCRWRWSCVRDVPLRPLHVVQTVGCCGLQTFIQDPFHPRTNMMLFKIVCRSIRIFLFYLQFLRCFTSELLPSPVVVVVHNVQQVQHFIKENKILVTIKFPAFQ